MVAAENAEQALAAYKAGDIDAVTNADFEPLALKLLEPFEDFRRRPHAAVNFYEINHERAPFDDRRVREALAIAIERERLTEGEMEGTTRPALSFLSFSRDPEAVIVEGESSGPIPGRVSYDPSHWWIVWEPLDDLPRDEVFEVTLAPGSVEDLTGMELDGPATFSFRTTR